MHRLASLPLLVPVAVLGLAVMLAEGWVLHRSRLAAVRELGGLAQLKQERDWLARQVPSLSAESEAALAAEVGAAGKVVEALKRELAGSEPEDTVAVTPSGSTEAFFELAEFVRKLRLRAGQAQVQVKADEFFSFASYANAGPAAELVAAVHRQRLATEYLVGQLLESRPLALLAVRRERPAGKGAMAQGDRTDDYFELAAPWSVRRPDGVGGEAYQPGVRRPTVALRNFLNRLGTCRQPVVVRMVQAEPLAAPDTTRASTAGPRGLDKSPLVAPAVSKFTVSLEIVRLSEITTTATP